MRLLHAQIGLAQIDGLIMKPSWPSFCEFSLVVSIFVPCEENCKSSLYETIKSIIYILSYNNEELEPTN